MKVTPGAARGYERLRTAALEHQCGDVASERFLQALASELPPLTAKRAPKKTIPTRKQRKEVRRAEHRERTGNVRDEVWKRSEGKCECGCGTFLGDGGELDHFRGAGSRRRLTDELNCWKLAPLCHLNKTRNRPSREHWVRRYIMHCLRNGIPTPPELRRYET